MTNTKFTILEINGIPLCIPVNNTGIVSVSNNKNGSELICLVKDCTAQRRSLNIGDCVEIKIIAQNSVRTLPEFKLPDNFNIDDNYLENETTISEGIEVIVGARVIYMPLISSGVLSVMLTVNKGKITINLGGMTSNNELLDYYYSELATGYNITISLKNLSQISEPIRRRKFGDSIKRNISQ